MADDAKFMDAIKRVEDGINSVLLGQQTLVRDFLTGILAGGHVLLEGLPGLGKTQMVRTFCQLCGLEARRIQFTPDLMPLDITGSNLMRERGGEKMFEFSPGPVFANLVIADEINRASPKTQAALLEAMQERQVTVLGKTHTLPRPFAVLATQNPIELEGTYPLPEAQLDRFLFKLNVEDVGAEVLQQIALGAIGGKLPDLDPVLTREEFAGALESVGRVELSGAVAGYIARLVVATRPGAAEGPAQYIKFGASPRAVIGLAAAARARAFIGGRTTVGFEDVKAVALPVLRHRVLLDYQARLEGVDSEQVAAELIRTTPELDRAAPDSLAAKIAQGR